MDDSHLYGLRVRHLGNIHAASVLPHNQASFRATDRVTQSAPSSKAALGSLCFPLGAVL